MDESFKIESAASGSGAVSQLDLIVLRARGLYADICDELERTDQDDDVRCSSLSNIADALDEGIQTLSYDLDEGAPHCYPQDTCVTLSDALIQMAAWQMYRRMQLSKGEYEPYGPGYVYTRKNDAIATIKNENRRLTKRLLQMRRCIICGRPLPEGSTGDHIIPTSKGGRHHFDNYLPMCPRRKGEHDGCNNGRGGKFARDLFEWLVGTDYPFDKLNPDVVVAYVRIVYLSGSSEEFAAPAPGYLIEAINRMCALVPRGVGDAIKVLRGDVADE